MFCTHFAVFFFSAVCHCFIIQISLTFLLRCVRIIQTIPQNSNVEIVSGPQHLALDLRVSFIVSRDAADGDDAVSCHDSLRRCSTLRLHLYTANSITVMPRTHTECYKDGYNHGRPEGEELTGFVQY